MSLGAVAVTSRRLAPTPVSGPMVLVAAVLACGPVGLDLVDLARDSEAVPLLLEAVLVAVLFTDASTVRWSALRRDDSLPLRLLGLGLPLTMLLGAVGAWLLLPGLTVGNSPSSPSPWHRPTPLSASPRSPTRGCR